MTSAADKLKYCTVNVIPEIHVLIDLFDYKNIAKSQPHANVKQL
jgi:hypothetical protein